MPKVIKKRDSKSGQSDENLMDTVDDIKSRLKSQQRTLALVFIVVIVVVVAAGGIYMYTRSQAQKADSFKSEAYQALNAAAFQPASAGDNFKKALGLFKQSYEIKERADVLLFISYCQYGLGNYDETINTLKQLTSKYRDPAVTPLAYYKLSDAYLKKGDQTNALAALNSIEGLNAGYKDMAVMQIARIYELQGKAEEAKAKYAELIEKYPNSELVREAKLKTGQK
jgi:predicted negative regulator of RcsB-dependent stress response